MPREWTREERKRKLREKYYRKEERIFVTLLFLFSIFFVLYLALTGAGNFSPPLQVNAGAIIIIAVVVYLLVGYGGIKYKVPIAILIAIFMLLLIITAFILAGSLSGVEQFIVYVILGILFLVIIAIAAFFLELYNYPGGE